MKLTLAITVYNRYDLLLESFAQVIDDPRIDEILICDDHSKDEYWNKIKELPKFNDKIKVVRQLENRGMSVNKRDAIFNAKNEWVIIFDSDNVIGKDYLDALENDSDLFLGGADNCIYNPEFAAPDFNFKPLGSCVMARTIKDQLWKSPNELSWFLNCCNYVVNREMYLKVWKENTEMKGSDTIWMAYLWLANGFVFRIVPNMKYFHRVHKDSGFLQDADYNIRKATEIQKHIMTL